MQETTFVMIKPDGTERGLSGQIMSRIEASGLQIADQKDIYVTKEQAERLYWEHRGKPFYSGLIDYVMSGKIKVMKVTGENALYVMRGLMGDTDPDKAKKGTIRADFRPEKQDGKVIKNTVHGSDSAASAKREIGIFFG